MSRYHVYYCSDCNVKFAVDQAFEDQSDVLCPLCSDDDALEGAGEAVDL
ncbi:MAG: hypothetical protein SCK28_01590 [Bacillota bacterium]|nr:hypothetical protein [Bacillota bacterium]